MIGAGDLRSRVGFFRRIQQDDGYGGSEAGYPDTPEFESRANIKPKLGGEQVLAGRLQGVNLVNITVKQSTLTASVTEAWMAKDMRSGEVFNIRSKIDPHQDGPQHSRFWEFLAEKGVAI